VYAELDTSKNGIEERIIERTHDLIVARDKAEEADRLKTAFLKNISHEVRTPLNAIVGFSRLLSSGVVDEENADLYASVIESNADDLLKLIEDIVDFSKYRAGDLKLNVGPLGVSDFWGQIELLLRSVFVKQTMEREGELKLLFSFDPQCNDEVIMADEERLKQVMVHLFVNALKFTKMGVIEIGCERRGEIVYFVKDSGIGISEDYQSSVFNTFNKREQDNSEVFRSTGIGLPLSMALVSLMGGKMWVVSKVDVGSTFYISFPRIFV
jgi:signal transduction histidine kinase